LENEQDDRRSRRPGASIRFALSEVKAADRVLCPPFTALATLRELLQATDIVWRPGYVLAGQGRLHGEISPVMLEELCQYVILATLSAGSIRETDEGVNRKVKAALATA